MRSFIRSPSILYAFPVWLGEGARGGESTHVVEKRIKSILVWKKKEGRKKDLVEWIISSRTHPVIPRLTSPHLSDRDSGTGSPGHRRFGVGRTWRVAGRGCKVMTHGRLCTRLGCRRQVVCCCCWWSLFLPSLHRIPHGRPPPPGNPHQPCPSPSPTALFSPPPLPPISSSPQQSQGSSTSQTSQQSTHFPALSGTH